MQCSNVLMNSRRAAWRASKWRRRKCALQARARARPERRPSFRPPEPYIHGGAQAKPHEPPVLASAQPDARGAAAAARLGAHSLKPRTVAHDAPEQTLEEAGWHSIAHMGISAQTVIWHGGRGTGGGEPVVKMSGRAGRRQLRALARAAVAPQQLGAQGHALVTGQGVGKGVPRALLLGTH